MRSTLLCVLAIALMPGLGHAQGPVYTITPGDSSIQFSVKSSVALAGKFDQWHATLKFLSPDVTSAVFGIDIEAASVDTGSGMKNNKLKGKDFFDVAHYPTITFHSTKVVQTGPVTFDVDGNFFIRGVERPEVLKLTISGKGTGAGAVSGVMVFNRRHYGMTKGIPFVRIEDHVTVTINIHGRRVSGSPLVYKQ